MKAFKFNWKSGWQWECARIQLLAKWIDREVSEIFKQKKEI